MGKVESTIKSEILRLAKKEVNTFFRPLVKEMRTTKIKLSKLMKDINTIGRWAKEKMQQDEEMKLKLEPGSPEVKTARLNPARIRKLRHKLDLSQKELGLLTGASLGTVAQWEKGKFAPKKDKKASLIALRKLGKREVKKILQQKLGRLEEKKPAERKVKKARRRRPSKKTRKARK
jgi:DNA-binding transcriptional regulator YiaG